MFLWFPSFNFAGVQASQLERLFFGSWSFRTAVPKLELGNE